MQSRAGSAVYHVFECHLKSLVTIAKIHAGDAPRSIDTGLAGCLGIVAWREKLDCSPVEDLPLFPRRIGRLVDGTVISSKCGNGTSADRQFQKAGYPTNQDLAMRFFLFIRLKSTISVFKSE